MMDERADYGRLVLGMKDGESVYVGDDIKVTVLLDPYSVHKIRLVFDAPKSCQIQRDSYKGTGIHAKRNA